MKQLRSHRLWGLMMIPLAVIILQSFGPDGWREPLVRLMWLSWAAVALAVAHYFRKVLYEYVDMEEVYDKALESAEGAGRVFLGVCILTAVIFFSLTNFARAQDVQTYVPTQAVPLLPVVRQQIDDFWPAMPVRSHMGSLIEQETCITLKHKFCWNPTARLKTDREEGGGLGQLTRAYNADGSLRFDALAETRAMDPKALKELNWETLYTRADLNIRAILVKLKDCNNKLSQQTKADPYNRTAFCDAAYNGGMGGLLNDRKLCALTAGCNAQVWFNNVEHTSGKSRTKWQGYGKSAFEINREHVEMAMQTRRFKYVPFFGGHR